MNFTYRPNLRKSLKSSELKDSTLVIQRLSWADNKIIRTRFFTFAHCQSRQIAQKVLNKSIVSHFRRCSYFLPKSLGQQLRDRVVIRQQKVGFLCKGCRVLVGHTTVLFRELIKPYYVFQHEG